VRWEKEIEKKLQYFFSIGRRAFRDVGERTVDAAVKFDDEKKRSIKLVNDLNRDFNNRNEL
jgi:hypothetical protein